MADTGAPAREPFVLPCGERIDVADLDMGLREFACECGATHAVVTDVHPPERFLPAFLVETLRDGVEVTDGFGEFGTPHLMGLVVEEFPDRVASRDTSDDGRVGYAMVWVADADARRLHEIVVELVVELMDHAVSHAEDDVAAGFEAELREFDVAEFVEAYRAERETTAEDVPGYGG
ncbi:MAG: DUF5815 family protein [Halobacteriales archaeon]